MSGETKTSAESTALALLAEVLYVPVDQIDVTTSFTELGLDSILAVEYIAMIKSELGVAETVESLYEHGTPEAFVKHVAAGA
ncbi:acyl carrier protein [Saccharopolyspora sp. NPDC000359]|uniref:acyl carrier protein n=1 Tax=Saccharopolyspora sp. NPDC000359 TaxID=3154251 RepID=UPI00331AB403